MAEHKKGYCQDCHEEVNISLENTTLQGEYKGSSYEYEGLCPSTDCGHAIPDVEVDSHNQKALRDTYRRRHDIISLEEIREIPTKYDIGKRPLSHLLQWGELTFTRYYHGDVPSKAYSQVLAEIYESPQAFLALLERNRSFISGKTYEKSKKAAEHCIQHSSKMTHVVQYLRQQDPDLSLLALHSLLYYCQGFYFGFFGEMLFDDKGKAGETGVVYEMLDSMTEGSRCINGTCHNHQTSPFTVGEKELIDSVLKELGCFSGSLLAKSIRSELPWLQARASLLLDSKEAPDIPQKQIESFFTAQTKELHSLHELQLYGEDIYKRR